MDPRGQPLHTPQPLHAGRPSYGAKSCPPRPATSASPADRMPPRAGATRRRRHGSGRAGITWRHRQIAMPSGDAEKAVSLFVERRDVLVCNRPVRLKSVFGPLAKVRWTIARPHRAIDIGGAADAVPHQYLRAVRPDVVVARLASLRDVRVAAGPAAPGPVGVAVGVFVRVKPGPLLKADDIEPSPAKDQCSQRSGRSRTDDQDVTFSVAGHRSRPRSMVRERSRSSSVRSSRFTSLVEM